MLYESSSKDQNRILWVAISLMIAVSVIVLSLTLWMLYQSNFEQSIKKLQAMVQGQVSLIESVAKFDKQFSQNVVDGGAGAATILQVTNAYSELGGFGKTGEFTLGIVRGDKIEFISEFRFPEKNARKIVPLTVDEGGEPIPMQQALNTGAGWMTGPDYRCEQKPRLILFDLMMPVMDGFDFLLEMRANADWQDILVIVLTAKDLTDENRHILSGRVEQIVEKGACSHAHLLEIIRSRAT